MPWKGPQWTDGWGVQYSGYSAAHYWKRDGQWYKALCGKEAVSIASEASTEPHCKRCLKKLKP